MNRARKFSFVLALLVVAGLVLTACGPKNATPDKKDTPATPAPSAAKKPAVGGELNLRLAKNPDNFNPIYSSTTYGSTINESVYARLFFFNEKFEPTPYVAESWSASADGLTWTIKLKQGVKFHDGSDLTADDVVFTLNSIMDKGYTGPRSSSVTSVKAFSAPDKHTVKIELKEPFAPIFTNINYGIMSKKAFEGVAVKDFASAPASQKPIGAGPYKFIDYKNSQYVMLERNDNWFFSASANGAPFIKTLRYKIIPDDTTAIAALENGEIDIDTPLAAEVGRLEKAGKLTSVNYERNGWGYITLNTSRPHLSDKRVRQALTYALNRQDIITGTMDGRGVIPAGPIPNVSWAYDASIKPFAFDVAKAKALLAEAGYKPNAQGIMEKDGQAMKLGFYGSSGSAQIEGIAQIAKKNWKEIGVELDIQLLDFNAMMDNFLKPGKFDISFSGFSLGLDPDQYTLWHTTQIPQTPTSAAFNRGRFSNAKVDEYLANGRKETDQAKRKAIYSDFQKLFVDEAPVILVYANKYTDMHSAKVKGVVNFPGSGATPTYLWKWYVNEQ